MTRIPIQLKVSTAAMKSTADSVRNQLTNIKSAFENLDTTVSRTIGYWESDAAEHHRSTYTSYKDRIETALKRIDEQVVDLGQMAGVYEKAEVQNTSISNDLPDDLLI